MYGTYMAVRCRQAPAPDVAQAPALRVIDLSFNQLTGQLPTPESLPAGLQELGLDHNFFSGTLPTYPLYSHLRVLNFSSNEIDGSLPPTYPLSLEILSVADNHINGTIPEQVFHLVWWSKLFTALALNIVWYRSCYVCCFLHSARPPAPVTGTPQGNLTSIQLSANPLKGSLPPSISCPKLATLQLQNTLLSGSLPQWVGSLAQLEVLEVCPTQALSRTWPFASFLCSPNECLQFALYTTTLYYSDAGRPDALAQVSRTDLTGSISGTLPESIASLTKLKVHTLRMLAHSCMQAQVSLFCSQKMFLNGNKITGTVPNLSGMASLQHLGLYRCYLDPSVSHCIAHHFLNSCSATSCMEYFPSYQTLW